MEVIDKDGNVIDWEDGLVREEIKVESGQVLRDSSGDKLVHPNQYSQGKRTSTERLT